MTPAPEAGTPARVALTEVLDTETIDVVIDSLLRADPPPFVAAAADTGLLVPMPAAVPVPAKHVITGITTALELCVPGDLAAIVEAWERARLRHGAQTSVHLRRAPERAVTLHFVDARHRFGVWLAIFVGTDGQFEDESRRNQLFRPRVCSFERDEVSVIRKVDAAVSKILGWPADELIGTRTLDLIHPDDRALAIANWMEMLGRPGSDQRLLVRMRHREGDYSWFEITNRNLLNDPAHPRVLSELVDVSERMEAAEALRASEQLLRRLTQALPLGVIQLDIERRIVYRNELVGEILAQPQAGTFEEQFARVARADRAGLERALAAVLGGEATADVEVTVAGPGGTRRASVAIRALNSERGAVTGAIACITDVTERVRLREELERRAKFDNLTRCHNRVSILEILDAVLHANGRTGNGVAVIFVDLNHFKEVNDRHGHAAGDELLRLTGERLLSSVRGGDIVGRLGGDEFLIVCPDVPSSEIALEIAHRIGTALAQRTRFGGTTIVPGASIGVAWTDRASDGEALVAAADGAMYSAKRSASGPVLSLG